MFDKQSLVVQANRLIMAPQKFTYEEKRFLICLISKINPADEEFKNYRIKFDEYASFVGQDLEDVRKTLPKVTKGIMSQILEIENEEDEELYQRAIINKATHYRKYGFVDVKIDNDMKDVLLDLKERFTQYKLENALSMRSKHAIRLYEIIKANEFKEQKTFRLTWSDCPKPLRHEYPKEEIQKLLSTDYKRFIDFENRVLKPAQKEMKKHTDVYFEYKKVKVSRFLAAIDFFIKENVPTENHNQMSFLDVMPVSDKIKNKSVIEMAAAAEKTLEDNRDKVCRKFQEAIKREYGVDFQLAMLEGISTVKIADILPLVGTWNISARNTHSVTKYIMKVLKEK